MPNPHSTAMVATFVSISLKLLSRGLADQRRLRHQGQHQHRLWTPAACGTPGCRAAAAVPGLHRPLQVAARAPLAEASLLASYVATWNLGGLWAMTGSLARQAAGLRSGPLRVLGILTDTMACRRKFFPGRLAWFTKAARPTRETSGSLLAPPAEGKMAVLSSGDHFPGCVGATSAFHLSVAMHTAEVVRPVATRGCCVTCPRTWMTFWSN